MENIHSEMYSLLIETYIKNDKEKDKLSMLLIIFLCIKAADWAIKWIEDEKSSFASRLIAFACRRNIFQWSILHLLVKKRGLMPGLTFSNELISRDEALHTEFAVLLYNNLNKKLEKKNLVKL